AIARLPDREGGAPTVASHRALRGRDGGGLARAARPLHRLPAPRAARAHPHRDGRRGAASECPRARRTRRPRGVRRARAHRIRRRGGMAPRRRGAPTARAGGPVLGARAGVPHPRLPARSRARRTPGARIRLTTTRDTTEGPPMNPLSDLGPAIAAI